MSPSEIERLLQQDNHEKKNIANASKHVRTHCGKGGGVIFPSDYLTRKEKQNMNSAVVTYSLNKPMVWDEFKALPKDLQIEYIKLLRFKYKVPDVAIASFMGVDNSTISKYNRKLGLGLGRDKAGDGKRWYKSEEAKEFYNWLEKNGIGIEIKIENADVKEEEVEPEPLNDILKNKPSVEPVLHEIQKQRKVTPESGDLVFECMAGDALNMLNDILGDSKVHLSVIWYVCDEDGKCAKNM